MVLLGPFRDPLFCLDINNINELRGASSIYLNYGDASHLHGVSGSVGVERTREVILYLGIGRSVLLTELHTNTRGTVALSPFGGYPDHGARDGYFLRLIHQGKQHEDLVAYLVDLVGGHKQAAVFKKWHVRRVQYGLVLDSQRKYAVTAFMRILVHCESISPVDALSLPLDQAPPNTDCHRPSVVCR